MSEIDTTSLSVDDIEDKRVELAVDIVMKDIREQLKEDKPSKENRYNEISSDEEDGFDGRLEIINDEVVIEDDWDSEDFSMECLLCTIRSARLSTPFLTVSPLFRLHGLEWTRYVQISMGIHTN